MLKFDKKLFSIAIIIAVVFSIFLIGYRRDQIKQLTAEKLDNSISFKNTDTKLQYSIDNLSVSNDKCYIKGWAASKDIPTLDVVPSIILLDEQNNCYKVKTRIEKRQDLNDILKDTALHNNAGIYSEFYIKGLDKNTKYKIGIQMQINNNNYFIWTDKIIDFNKVN